MWLLDQMRHRRNSETESRVAVAQSKQNLAKVQQRAQEVTAVSAASKKLLQQNHLAEKLQGIMGGY
jgi:hypothetical protein